MFLARTSCHRGVTEINCGMRGFLTFTRKKFQKCALHTLGVPVINYGNV